MCNTIKDLNLALNHDTTYHFNIKMTENIKYLPPLQMKQVPYAYLNLKKNSDKVYKKKNPGDFVTKNVEKLYTQASILFYSTHNKFILKCKN